ncbi:MAG: hypothetical protein ACFFBP_12525 [Promethearchaeota archaeon]
MKVCEDCGNEIEDDLNFCPICEEKNRRKKQFLAFFLIFLILGIPLMTFLGILFS